MKRFSFILTLFVCASMAFASSNGGVRHLQPNRVPVIIANYQDIQIRRTDFNEYKSSIEQYFADQSYGQYTPKFEFIGSVMLSHNQKYYGENDYYGDDMRADEMVQETCNLAEDLADFTQYDQDGDGKIDAIVIIYAGEGEKYGESNFDAVWAYTANLEESDEIDSYVVLDGKMVTYFSAVPEMQSPSKRDGIGTLVHEFAHILGLPNMCSTDGGVQKTLGDWSVMDHGCYNNESRTPASMSAYERFFLGWVEPILLDGPMNVRLGDLNKTGDCAIITASGQHNLNGLSPDPREFYILENRQQEGWDKFLPGHGLMLTKIDYVKNKWESDEVNNVERHSCVDLIEADGSAPKYKADNLTNGYFGKKGDLFPAGATEKYMFSNKMYFTNVREQNGVIFFDFNGGVDKCQVNFSVSNGTCATKSLTETKKGAGVKLPSVTANSGYTFLGWSTRKNSNIADAGQPGETFYPMSDCSVFAVMQDNTRYWVNYDWNGVEIGDYIDFNGAYIKVNAIHDIAVTFIRKAGYATPTAETCPVRVVCGGKQIPDVARYVVDTVIVSIPAAAITGDIYITVTNAREQKEDGCDTYSHTFTKECRVDSKADLSGYEWQVSIAEDHTISYDKNKGAVFGSGTYPAGQVKLVTSDTQGCGVAMVRVTAAANGDGVLSVFVAGNQVGETEALYSDLETYEFELDEPTSGKVEIRLENTTKAMYLKQIEIYYDLWEDPQGIEIVESRKSKVKSEKMIMDGQLYILYNGQIYNVLGNKITK